MSKIETDTPAGQLAYAMMDASTALSTAREAELYFNNPPTDHKYGIRIDWSWGSVNNTESKHGLEMIKTIVTRMIEEQMFDLVAQAVHEIQRRAAERKQIVADLLKVKG